MPHRSTVWRTTLVFSLLPVFVIGALAALPAQAQTTARGLKSAAQGCGSLTDDEIVRNVRRKIGTDKLLRKQSGNVEVSSSDHEVTLTGRVQSQADVRRVGKYVRSISCVKKVVNNLMACGPGQIPCGDECIPKDMPCSYKKKTRPSRR